MLDIFWLSLLLKAFATALVVVVASVVAEKAGPRWGGLVASFPVSAGPAYVLLALQHDAAFIADSALLSFAGGAATWIFISAFVTFASRRGLVGSLLGAIVVWLGAAIVIRTLPWTLLTATGVNVAAFALALRFAGVAGTTEGSGRHVPRTWVELPVRALSVGAFVALVVTASSAIGPAATGLGAIFPIALTSLAIITYRRFGLGGATAALSGAVKPLIGISCGFAVLAATADALGSWTALCLALAAAVVWPLIILVRRRP
jgi:uncharacterized membrane protein (GlpM family)